MKIIIYVPVQQKKNSDSNLTLHYFLYLLELPHRVDQEMWAGRIGGFVEDDVHKVSTTFVQTDGRVENHPSRYKNKNKKQSNKHTILSHLVGTGAAATTTISQAGAVSDLCSGLPSPGVSGEEQSLSVGRLAATPAVAAGHGCHAHCSQPIRRSLAEVEGRKRKSSDKARLA